MIQTKLSLRNSQRLDVQRSCTVLSMLLMILFFLPSCQTIQRVTDPPVSYALAPTTSGPLAQTAKKVQQGKPKEQSHFLLLDSAYDALMWRLNLIDSATRSIDIQTFLWAKDHSGKLLYDRLVKAAHRGVRVRVLVDDIWLTINDKELASINQHPNLELRIYNPSYIRSSKIGRVAYFIAHFHKMNRRMHNKSFIVDGTMAIHGGRNIGDHYFGLDKTYNFRDLDVLSVGPVLNSMEEEFDIFWNSPLSYPAAYITQAKSPEQIQQSMKQRAILLEDKSVNILSSYPTQPKSWHRELETLPRRMLPGTARFVSDPPSIEKNGPRIMVGELGKMLNKAKKEIIIVTPYFIPYQRSFDGLRNATKKGIRTRILVPSLGANNHTPAHSHYRKYRRTLLESGAELFEYNFQPSTQQRALCDVAPIQAKWIGLHLKTVIVDRKHTYIGSLNLDPRAMNINTEEGLIIDSPILGKELAEKIEVALQPENSWQITLDNNNRLRWKGAEAKPLYRQPARGMLQRLIDAVARWIPIEKEL